MSNTTIGEACRALGYEPVSMGIIMVLKDKLRVKREAQAILDACTQGAWGTNNEPPYTEQQALKAKEAYDDAVSGMEKIIDEL